MMQGNVKDTTYDIDFFKSFDLVLNGEACNALTVPDRARQASLSCLRHSAHMCYCSPDAPPVSHPLRCHDQCREMPHIAAKCRKLPQGWTTWRRGAT